MYLLHELCTDQHSGLHTDSHCNQIGAQHVFKLQVYDCNRTEHSLISSLHDRQLVPQSPVTPEEDDISLDQVRGYPIYSHTHLTQLVIRRLSGDGPLCLQEEDILIRRLEVL
jgi:hypothetical protein